MILPVAVTTRNRSRRGNGSPVLYLDGLIEDNQATTWNIRTRGIRVIRTRNEQRLSFQSKHFGKMHKGEIVDIEVEFIYRDVFTAYTISPEPNYAYFACPDYCGSIFQELLDKQPMLARFNWVESVVDIEVDSPKDEDVFGLWIRSKKRDDLFMFSTCDDYEIKSF